MNNTIQIPASAFLPEVQRTYSSYQDALYRELIQNSRDAGATEMHFQIDANGLVCRDNGKGMDEATLKAGMLTYGGSVKDEGATGGFGEAKKLVTLCHDQYEILTQNLRAYGSGIHYEIEEVSTYLHGTQLTIVPCAEFGWDDAEEQVRKLERIISKSDLPIDFYINGTLYPYSTHRGRKVGEGEMEWATLYGKKVSYDCYSIDVRVNGLFMFSHYLPISGGIKRKFVLEIQTSVSRDVLTANRDSLKNSYRAGLDSLVADICQNTNRYKAAKPRKYVYKGNNGPLWGKIKQFLTEEVEIDEDAISQLQPIDLANDGVSAEEVTENILETVTKQLTELGHASAVERITSAVSQIRESVTTFIAGTPIENDFLIDLADSNYRDIPKKYTPGNMGARAEKLAKFWKYALKTVIEIEGTIEGPYTIGFKFDSDNIAMREGGDVPVYWMNPDAERFTQTKEGHLAFSVIQIAVHEVAHHWVNTHNEAFICTAEELLLKVMTHPVCKNLNQWAKEAKKEVI